MSCNCKTTSPSCEPCAFCTPPGVTCLTTCTPPDPCDGETVDLCCVTYSGEDHECSGITNGQPLCEILIQALEVLFPPDYCCALTGTITLITTTTTIAPTTTTSSTSTTTSTSTTSTTSTTSSTTTTTTSTTTTTTTAAPIVISTNILKTVYRQCGSAQGKFAIENFEIILNPSYTSQGIYQIKLDVPSTPSVPQDVIWSFFPYKTMPYTSLNLPIPSNITTELKNGGSAILTIYNRITDGTTIYIVESSTPLRSWNTLNCPGDDPNYIFNWTTTIYELP